MPATGRRSRTLRPQSGIRLACTGELRRSFPTSPPPSPRRQRRASGAPGSAPCPPGARRSRSSFPASRPGEELAGAVAAWPGRGIESRLLVARAQAARSPDCRCRRARRPPTIRRASSARRPVTQATSANRLASPARTRGRLLGHGGVLGPVDDRGERAVDVHQDRAALEVQPSTARAEPSCPLRGGGHGDGTSIALACPTTRNAS